MSGFTNAALEKKLAELNSSQQSIQTLSLWLIHHRKHHKLIVQVWFKELKKAKPAKKLTFMYLANDVVQNSKKKGPEFTKEYATVLKKAFDCVSHKTDEKTFSGLMRVLSVWEERAVYDSPLIEEFRQALLKNQPKSKAEEVKPAAEAKVNKPKKTQKRKVQLDKKSVEDDAFDKVAAKKKKPEEKKVIMQINIGPPAPEVEVESLSPPRDPPEAEELIRALQELETSASTDATVREKIASLPPEVSDSTLLEKIQGEDRDAAERLSKQVDEACTLLADYNSRLADELEDRKLVARMLADFIKSQRDHLSLSEQKLEEYKDKQRKVTQVRNELKSHLQNLPDLTLLPNVTGGLKPLPSAGDLFSLR